MEDKILEIEAIKKEIEEEVWERSIVKYNEVFTLKERAIQRALPFVLMVLALVLLSFDLFFIQFFSLFFIYKSFSWETQMYRERVENINIIYNIEMRKQVKTLREELHENNNKL